MATSPFWEGEDACVMPIELCDAGSHACSSFRINQSGIFTCLHIFWLLGRASFWCWLDRNVSIRSSWLGRCE